MRTANGQKGGKVREHLRM